MSKRVYVINSRGAKEPFSFENAYNSVKRADASLSLAEKITEIIKKDAFSGIKTSDH